MSLNLAQYLDIAAQSNPNSTAVILDDFRMTYTELLDVVKRVANALRQRGIGRGDKVAMMIPNTPYFSAVYYGILNVGATVVPVNILPFQMVETCHHFVVVSRPDDHTAPRAGENFLQFIGAADSVFDPVQTMPDDTAVILYTSGTTGHPKGAELTHCNMFFNAYYVMKYIVHAKPGDVGLVILPLFHSFGQTCLQNATLMAGATMTMLPSFDTHKAMHVVQRDRVTMMAAVPTMYFFMLNIPDYQDYDFSSVRMAVSGGSALPVEVLNKFEERYGVRILEGYGLSETSPVASFNILDRPSKAGSIGIPIWGCDMRVMRDDGSIAEVGEVGEIVLRGHNLMKGYYKKPTATEEAIVDGWFHTGDMAHVDNEGYFFIVDRKKDLIIRGGMNIYPREIEEVLYAHPAVLEAAVVGIPDEARGEEVKAYLSPRDGHEIDANEVIEYCQDRLARFKCPKEVEVLPSLPKGPTGKILKRELRDRARA
ncbi:MAG: long-chain fatty acid--CoA ligase [Candidatus Hydrogenedentes bacterium]|nr:long-chain fatty acid--CoA ligase [Candidatus Hydrogenedentota bacterium]